MLQISKLYVIEDRKLSIISTSSSVSLSLMAMRGLDCLSFRKYSSSREVSRSLILSPM